MAVALCFLNRGAIGNRRRSRYTTIRPALVPSGSVPAVLQYAASLRRLNPRQPPLFLHDPAQSAVRPTT